MAAVMTAYLGLGSNLGEREGNLRQAIALLGRKLRLIRCSSVYETTPWGFTEQPNFLNCVLEAETELAPQELLRFVKETEQEAGRLPNFRYGPRLIDVDILLQGDLVVDQPDLQIPHARLAERAFALVPLAELAPRMIHPTLGLTIAQLLIQVDGKEGVKLWGSPLPFP